MLPTHLLGSFCALVASTVWGFSDFSGGRAARRQSQFQVLVLTSLSGVFILAILVLAFPEKTPSLQDLAWAGSAGIFGAFGIALLYDGLSRGQTGLVAPVSAVVGTVIPVLVGLLTEKLPTAFQGVGFLIAMAGIWLSHRAPGEAQGPARGGLLRAFGAGACFGGFFTLIAQVEAGNVFIPLLVARSAALILAVLIVIIRRERLPRLSGNPLAVLAGILDVAGNVFYLLASQLTRQDVAVVLSSLYPAVTVLLASRLLKEKISLGQWIGAGLCFIAVGFIAR